jgi:hypothetical protein
MFPGEGQREGQHGAVLLSLPQAVILGCSAPHSNALRGRVVSFAVEALRRSVDPSASGLLRLSSFLRLRLRLPDAELLLAGLELETWQDLTGFLKVGFSVLAVSAHVWACRGHA